MDLLALAPDASLVLIELKRERTPRDVVAQALDYAAWVERLEPADVAAIYRGYSGGEDLAKALPVLLELADVQRSGVFASMLALNALDALGNKAKSAAETIRKLPKNPKPAPPRTGGYVSRLLQSIVDDLQ